MPKSTTATRPLTIKELFEHGRTIQYSELPEALWAATGIRMARVEQFHKVHFVVVYNLTRFAREKYDHFALRAHLQSLGISLRSATEPIDDTSTGKLMEGVLAAFAQFDNDVRSDRTKAGMKAALEVGRWTFVAPLGYLNAPRWAGRSLTHDPERGPLMRRAFEDLQARATQRKKFWPAPPKRDCVAAKASPYRRRVSAS